MQKLLSYINEIHQEFPQDENLSLNKSAVADYSVPTTTVNGHRSRHTSGIFLPKFYLSQGVGIFPTPSKAEFVEWLISRNKPSNRTNKASRLTAVVETISHPLQGGNHLLITVKRLFKMLSTQSVTTPQKQPPLHLATLPIFSPPCGELPSMGEVVHTPMEDEHIHQKSQKLTKSVIPEQIPSLLSVSGCGYDGITTKTINADRKRYLSGIFLPTIPQSYGITTPVIYSEFAVRATRRTKASNRANNADCLMAVVEPLPHLFQAVSFINKLTRTIKMPTIKHPAVADFPQNLTACDCTKQHEFLYETTNIVQNIREKSYKSYEPEQKTILPAVAVFGYPFGVVAKSTTSREKLNLLVANDSTPLTRAFFVRSLRTPNENTAPKNRERSFLSMVGRIGQPLAVGCVPLVAVSHPDTSYRPAVRSQAVALKSTNGAITMLFKFLVLGDKRLTISIRAKSEQEARQKLQFTSPALCVARYNTSRSSKGGIYA